MSTEIQKLEGYEGRDFSPPHSIKPWEWQGKIHCGLFHLRLLAVESNSWRQWRLPTTSDASVLSA